METLLLRKARVVDPASKLDDVRDVLVEAGRIARVAASIPKGEGRSIDLDGLVLAPGFIDIHVHLREPGQESKETIASGCAAAASGGFTAVALMANTNPVNDCRAVTEMILGEARRHSSVRVYPVGAVSAGLEGKRLAEIGEMVAAGARAISDDGRPIMDGSLMRRALEYSQIFNIPVLVHEQDETQVGAGAIHEGEVSTRLGLPGWPAAGEDAMIARDIMLAEDYGGRLHIQHLTTARGLSLVSEARKRGLPVTCEVTPHHLLLTDQVLLEHPYDTDFKMNPPLRSETDRLALVKGLNDESIDAIATDHAPHHSDEKDAEFCCAPFGTIGLETSIPACLTRLFHTGDVTLPRLVHLMSTGPARALGVAGGRLRPGDPADITVLDLDREAVIEPSRFQSLSSNTVFKQWRVKGVPVMTIVGGEVVLDTR